MVEAATNSQSTIVTARGVTKRFHDQLAVKQLSFDLHENQILGFVGANGGGKTTSLRLLAGLLRPGAGELTVLGNRLPDHAAKARTEIGYVSQKQALYSDLSVMENLQFYAQIYGDRRSVPSLVSQAVEQFSLTPVANKRLGQLSGGWGRVAQFAASTIHQPKLLLLDEPTTGLDASMKAFIWQHIQEFAQNGRSVIVSTHDLDEAPRCDQLLYFANGAVTLRGTPMDITKSSSAVTVHLTGKNLPRLAAELEDEAWCYFVSHEMNGLSVILAGAPQEKLSGLAADHSITITKAKHTLAHACLAHLKQKGNEEKELSING